MQRRNFQKELDSVIAPLAADSKTPTLLLHSCCAPCSSYCLLYLSQYFQVTVFYYNPNITDEAEYRRRVQEQKKLICAYNERIAANVPLISETDAFVQNMPQPDKGDARQTIRRSAIRWIEGDYAPDRFFAAAKGLEHAPEGGARCEKCFALRLNETAALAAKEGFDYFTTTLTISPLKDAVLLNEIGETAAHAHHAVWLPSDFKKRGGYQQSIALSREYDLYRQNYCGCIFSEREAAQKRAEQIS